MVVTPIEDPGAMPITPVGDIARATPCSIHLLSQLLVEQ